MPYIILIKLVYDRAIGNGRLPRVVDPFLHTFLFGLERERESSNIFVLPQSPLVSVLLFLRTDLRKKHTDFGKVSSHVTKGITTTN